MVLVDRIGRHCRLSYRSMRPLQPQTPPFMVVFINSICNLTCEHCFYWRNLNQRDDLTFDEFEKLSGELGEFENLNLSGGEPFIRPEFAEICSLFVQNNGVKMIYVPTNGYFTDRTEKQLRKLLTHKTLQLFVLEFSLDGMPEYHNRFRGNAKSFDKLLDTYEMAIAMQKEDSRVRVHANIVATNENMEELYRLSDYLHQRCPDMEHLNLAVIRGDRKNPALKGPALEQYKKLYEYIKTTWRDREKGRFGSIVEPLLQWTKCKTMETQSQYVPCTAGNMTGVVYANGDVSFCEIHEPIGNLRNKSFFDIWYSEKADRLRRSIGARECHCTTEVFMWPSIVYQPVPLTRAMIGARKWILGSHSDEDQRELTDITGAN